MTNVYLILAMVDIALSMILIVVYRIPPLTRAVTNSRVMQRYWQPTWPALRTVLPFLILALIALLWAFMLLIKYQ
ncbi:hypothetical protein [Nocardia sp. NBC_00511]|uniref:hypothetical protein n=1 Tax=Nocardia sp. NBC_00511 TaxID=2903591 RepID=UPI0030E0ED40